MNLATRQPVAAPLLAAWAVSFAAWLGGCASSPSSDMETLERRNAALEARLAETQAELGRVRAEMEAIHRGAQSVAPTATADEATQAMAAELEAERQRRVAAEAEARRLEQLAGLVPKADAAAGFAPRFETVSADGGERVRGPSILIDDTRGILKLPHYLRVGYDRPAAGEPRVWIEVDSFGQPNRRYQAIDNVAFVIDGQTNRTLPVAEFDVFDTRTVGSTKARSTTYDVRLVLDVDRDTLRRLAEATQVVMILGGDSIELNREHVALFLAVQTRLGA